MANKYQEKAPKISAVLTEAEIEKEINENKINPKKEISKPLNKDTIQETIKYIKYLGASVVTDEGVYYVSHGFLDIANKLNSFGLYITETQVEELYNEWKQIVNQKVFEEQQKEIEENPEEVKIEEKEIVTGK